MKKIICLSIVILSFLLARPYVNAEEDTTCNYSSKAALSKAAYNVDANYTIRKDEQGNNYFEIAVYNVTDEIYVVVENDVSAESIYISSDMTNNNNYTFKVYDLTTIINYTLHIRGFKYGCNDEFRKITILKPRYNDLSELAVCKNDMMLDYSYCQPWVNRYFRETREEVIERINNQFSKKNSQTTTKCISCEQDEKAKKKLAKKRNMRIAIIIGLVVGIILDIAVIVLLIIRLKRYDIWKLRKQKKKSKK